MQNRFFVSRLYGHRGSDVYQAGEMAGTMVKTKISDDQPNKTNTDSLDSLRFTSLTFNQV